jgi:nitroreductase
MNNPVSAWKINEREFPRGGTPDEKLRFLVRYAILAPSSHNTQPWRFCIEGPTLDIYADPERSLPIADPHDRELTISCGAALFNLRTAMNYFGCVGEARPFPDSRHPNLLAQVTLDAHRTQDSEWTDLFKAITRRVTDRGSFAPDVASPALSAALREAAHVEGAWLSTFSTDRSKATVGYLVAKGDRIQFENPEFRQELASWLNPPNKKEGLPAYARGAPQLLGFTAPAVAFLVRTFDVGNGVAARDRELAVGSPLIACLGTTRDTPLEWLNAGQALQRVLLLATAYGLHASFLNQPIEVAQLRRALGALAERKGYPQILLRIGRGRDTAQHTPRRPLEDVLIEVTQPKPRARADGA